MAKPQDFHLIDRMNESPAVNELFCSCGDRLWPDCDLSANSITEEFERHLREVHGFTQDEIDRALNQTSGINIAAKQLMRQESLARRAERKAMRRRWRQCFWTKPRGHRYGPPAGLWAHCVGCGKSKWVGSTHIL